MPSPDDVQLLRQHIEDLFSAHANVHELEGKALILARESAQRSLDNALTSMDKRLEGMNEFRASLSDMSSKAISRDEYMTAHAALDEKYDGRVRALEKMIYIGVGGAMLAGVVVNIILYFLTKK